MFAFPIKQHAIRCLPERSEGPGCWQLYSLTQHNFKEQSLVTSVAL